MTEAIHWDTFFASFIRCFFVIDSSVAKSSSTLLLKVQLAECAIAQNHENELAAENAIEVHKLSRLMGAMLQ